MRTIGRVIERIVCSERGEAELAQEGIGAIIFVALLAVVTVCIWQASAAASAIKTHVFNNTTAAALADRLNTEAQSALSITVPANDVDGNSNADGHEIAFFARSATGGPNGTGQDLFWGYVWSAATSTVQEYKWSWNGTGFTTPVAYGAPFTNVTSFSSAIVLATQRANPASPYYMPVIAAIPNLSDISCSYGFSEYHGGNYTVSYRIQAGANGVDGTFPGILGQADILCAPGRTYVVGTFTATPTPCPVGDTGTAPNCVAPTPVPTPAPTAAPTAAPTSPGGGGGDPTVQPTAPPTAPPTAAPPTAPPIPTKALQQADILGFVDPKGPVPGPLCYTVPCGWEYEGTLIDDYIASQGSRIAGALGMPANTTVQYLQTVWLMPDGSSVPASTSANEGAKWPTGESATSITSGTGCDNTDPSDNDQNFGREGWAYYQGANFYYYPLNGNPWGYASQQQNPIWNSSTHDFTTATPTYIAVAAPANLANLPAASAQNYFGPTGTITVDTKNVADAGYDLRWYGASVPVVVVFTDCQYQDSQ